MPAIDPPDKPLPAPVSLAVAAEVVRLAHAAPLVARTVITQFELVTDTGVRVELLPAESHASCITNE